MCGDLLEMGSLAKGSQIYGWSWKGPEGQGTPIGAEWATSHSEISCGLLTARFQTVREASRQPAFMGSCLTICQTRLPCPHLVDGCGCSPGFGIKNKKIVRFRAQLQLVAWWLWWRTAASESLVRFPEEAKCVLSFCHGIGVGRGDNKVMCRGRQLFFPEWGKLRVWKGVAGVCWRIVGDGWWFFANSPV